MTYAVAWPLQEALFARLTASPAVTALIGDRIYDAPPQIDTPIAAAGPYALIGDEESSDWSTKTDRGADHLLRITVVAPERGFAEAKRAAGAICDALLDAPLSLSRGHVVGIFFLGAETERGEEDEIRRIELRLRVLIEDTA